MDIWFRGEIDEAAYEPFSDARESVTELIRSGLAAKRYGPAIREIAIIPIIMADGDGFPEIRKYHKRDKSLELRLSIPSSVFLAADLTARMSLLLGLLREAACEAERLSLSGFDATRFLNDVRDLEQAIRPRQKELKASVKRGGGSTQ